MEGGEVDTQWWEFCGQPETVTCWIPVNDINDKGGSNKKTSNFRAVCFEGKGDEMFEKVLSGAKSHHFSPEGC